MAADRTSYDVTDTLVGLAATLRAAGVDAGPSRVHAAVSALATLDATSRTDVYWAGRLTLCSRPDDLDRYDRVFTAYFAPTASSRGLVRPEPPRLHVVPAVLLDGDSADAVTEDESGGDELRVAASRTELLRQKDFAELGDAERAELARLLAALRLRPDSRRSRRTTPGRRGVPDRPRTLRRWVQAGGEPMPPAFRERHERSRRLVLLVDVSGSMSAYADALLRFAHAASRRDRGPQTEVFTIGTRLTRVTRELSHRDPETALRSVAAAVPDWSGGTRLGVLVKSFLDAWGQRGLARGAVVVLLSDGWERGDVTLLGEQMARLRRLAHRVVWANPRAGRPGFEPVAAGMAAALPHVDSFVSGHSLAALEELAHVVAGGRQMEVRTSA
ncbi:MAG: VWA domain-containing protein [Frankiales bacterium]|nr:VWA domain-containing protein [Frankiales bacterium]